MRVRGAMLMPGLPAWQMPYMQQPCPVACSEWGVSASVCGSSPWPDAEATSWSMHDMGEHRGNLENFTGKCVHAQDFARMQLEEISAAISGRRNKIFLLMEEVRRLRIQQRIKVRRNARRKSWARRRTRARCSSCRI